MYTFRAQVLSRLSSTMPLRAEEFASVSSKLQWHTASEPEYATANIKKTN